MKVTLEYDYNEEKEDVLLALKANSLASALHEIGQNVFRPARKHGYPEQKIQDLFNANENAEELIGLLETKFHQILNEHDVAGLL
jgi:hypothetical protein